MKNSKRILSVTLKTMFDDSPDTSHLGEYSSKMESDFSIDRAHALDCIENDIPQKQKLERIASWIENDRPVCEEHIHVSGEDCDPCREEKAYTDALDEVQALAECDGCAHLDRNTYRFFNGPVENYKGESPADIRKYVRQDFERAEALNRGDWNYIGIRAEARVFVNEKVIGPVASHGIAQTITSGGLYGVESDSDASYLAEVQRDELASLKDELVALGFSRRAISAAYKNVQERED